MSTPRTGETLRGHTGDDVLDRCYRIIAPETGEEITSCYTNGASYTLEIARIVGTAKAYLKGGSPACDAKGVTGEVWTVRSMTRS